MCRICEREEDIWEWLCFDCTNAIVVLEDDETTSEEKLQSMVDNWRRV